MRQAHAGEPVHKACAEGRIAANPVKARFGRFASDTQSKSGRRDTHVCPLPPEAPMRNTDHDVDHAPGYPKPPASPLWHRHGRVQDRPGPSPRLRRSATSS
ncbi:hypothetical protein GCM10010302_17700 [Streptomyces polychromogenes]|uniref:Uncharacterized protein n=1 Tax=Streptomyces polychromogenes TaxID=67342 RepID=A0ABN0V886_9ACTN